MGTDLKQLNSPPAEGKLRLLESLWGDIEAYDEPVILHPWQANEAGRKSAELQSDPSIAIDCDELCRRVNGYNCSPICSLPKAMLLQERRSRIGSSTATREIR